MSTENVEGQRRRFKHQSYQAQIKEVHLPSPLSQKPNEQIIEDNQSQFHAALDHWRQLNLTPAFLKFAKKAEGLSASLPLLLHNWEPIADLWVDALAETDLESKLPLLDLLQKLILELRTTLAPKYETLWNALLTQAGLSLPLTTLETYIQTLSVFLKHLLPPSPSLLEPTWRQLASSIRKCRPDVQRMLAEVWATVLRRLKSDARTDATKMLIEELDTIEDAATWVYISAFQTVSCAIHTSTVPLLTVLWDVALVADNFEPLFTLLRRVLTAVMHWCTVDTFRSIGEFVVARNQALDVDSDSAEALHRTLQLTLVVCAFRKGKRSENLLTPEQTTAILAKVPSIPTQDVIGEDICAVLVACLKGSDMSTWARGRAALEHVWKDTRLGYRVASALSKLDHSKGSNWKAFILPQVRRAILKNDSHLRFEALALLDSLVDDGRDLLSEESIAKVTEELCHSVLIDWNLTEESMVHLRHVLNLTSRLQSIGKPLAHLTDEIMQAPVDPTSDPRRAADLAWCIGSSMSALGTIQGWNSAISLDSWVKICLVQYNRSAIVLEGLTSLLHLCTAPITFADAFISLKASVGSPVGPLRLQSLRFLASNAVQRDLTQSLAVNACLLAESVEITSTRTPERVLKTGKLSTLTPVGQGSDATELCIRWLVAQLKVNLMPLWKTTCEAIGVLIDRCGEEVWPIIKAEFDLVFEERQSSTPTLPGISGDEERPYQEDQKTWRSPGLQETKVALSSTSLDNLVAALAKERLVSERFDVDNYEKQLLKTLEGRPRFAERHNRDLIPLFLSFASPDLPTKPSFRKLGPWLALFSKFTNPKAVYASTSLHSLYTSLLSHPERTMQLLAVDSILSYKSKALTAHEATIRGLLDDNQWKEHLIGLDFSEKTQEADRLEVVDLLIRLFYGMLRERRGRNKLHDRRTTLLSALRKCNDEELGTLVHLMLEPFNMSATDTRPPGTDSGMVTSLLPPYITWKQQVGFLVLQADVMRLLGRKLRKFWPSLLTATILITANAQKALEAAGAAIEEQQVDEAQFEEADLESEGGEVTLPYKIARNLRQLGIKRFNTFFHLEADFDFVPFLPIAFEAIISPRLEALNRENTQAPSGLLELFHTWSSRTRQVSYLVAYDARVLPSVMSCLVAPNVKPSVILRVFDIVENILNAASQDTTVTERLVQPHLSPLLETLAAMIRKGFEETDENAAETSRRQIRILWLVSDFIVVGNHASMLLPLLLPLLEKPASKVNESVKQDLLQVISRLLQVAEADSNVTGSLSSAAYRTVSGLLQTLRSRQARISAAQVFLALSKRDVELVALAQLLEDLNSFDKHRPEEPDFDRRMDAFTRLNEVLYQQLSPHQWLPLLHNMLHFAHDREEISIRNNASYTLRRFIELMKLRSTPELDTLFGRILFPGIKAGVRSKAEPVRSEFVSVLAFAIKERPELPSLHDMTPLLANGDEEANFFFNIAHIQIHRRTRAMRRLSTLCETGQIRSSTLNDIFIPLIGHYIGDSFLDHSLVNEAIITVGHISRHLIWSRYYSLVLRYIKLVKEKGPSVKSYVRTVIAILDNFHFSMDTVVESGLEEDQGEQEDGPQQSVNTPALNLKIAEAVNNRLLPALLHFLEKREEAEDVLRIPMAIGIAKVALHLPDDRQRSQVTKLITILCQALRSKSSETRDLTRDTLCKIQMTAGPSYLSIIVQELRVALTRGPQLHVLAVTCHLLLHHVVTPEAKGQGFSTVDDIVGDVAEVFTEVIFGQSGKDLHGEDFKTTYREVRGSASKGLDGFSLLAGNITPDCVARLLLPLRSIMHETESIKVMQLVDECLKRTAAGLNSNSLVDAKGLLLLCHALISQNAKFLQERQDVKRRGGTRKNFIVQSKRDLPQASGHYAHNSFRFVAFGLDLLVVAFRRNRFDFQDPDIIARLNPMVNLVGNTLYSSAASVVILGLKSAASIVKAPLPSVPKSLPAIVRQQVEIIKQAGSAESELAQTALRSLGSVLRECPTATLKEADLKLILEVAAPDLEEVERQGAIFALLRAIINRKLVVPEVYDMMDRVSNVMVTNQSTQVQEICRSILLQFLLDYPQGRGRLRKQMTFFASNLSYVFESGRLSVMTLLDAIFHKFEPKLIAEYADIFLAALVMVLANDDSSTCREKASSLLKALYSGLDRENRHQFVERLHVWASQSGQGALASVSAQAYGIVIDASMDDIRNYLSVVVSDLNRVLDKTADSQSAINESLDDSMDVDLDWQPAYHALLSLTKLLKAPSSITESVLSEVSWHSVVDLMLFPHAWVRTGCSRLIGSFFSSRQSLGDGFDLGETAPGTAAGMITIAKNSCIQLRSEHLDQPLSLQTVKNLVYVAKKLYEQASNSNHALAEDDEDSDSSEEGDEGTEKTKEERIIRAPLPWLFSKLSYQTKTAHLKRRNSFRASGNWHLETLAILQWFAAMVAYLEAETLERYLVHILTPVYRILDDDTIRDAGMDELKVLAQELQDLVQAKVGISKFTAVYGQIRQGTLAIRRERKAARSMLVASNPQAAANRQIQRNTAKRDSRKRKSQALRETKSAHFPSKKKRVD